MEELFQYCNLLVQPLKPPFGVKKTFAVGLIFAVPGALLLLADSLKNFSARSRYLSVGITALGFAAVSLLGVSYLRAQGNASENMAVGMEDNGVIEQSAPGAMFPHARQHF